MARRKRRPVVIVVDGSTVIQTDTVALALVTDMAGQMRDDIGDYYRDRPQAVRDEAMRVLFDLAAAAHRK